MVALPSRAWCPFLEPTASAQPTSKGSEPAEGPEQFAECINSIADLKGVTWDAAMHDEPASVAVAGAWWSSKQRQVPVTLITQVSET